jgi:hypothetical protein
MPDLTQRITRTYSPTGSIGRRLTTAHDLQLQSQRITAELTAHRAWICDRMIRLGLDRIEQGDLIVTRKVRHKWTYTPETEAAMAALRKIQEREQAEGLATDNPTVYVALTTTFAP